MKGKDKTEKTKSELFDCWVSNIAYHATLFFSDKGLVRCSAVPNLRMVTIRIDQKNDHPDVWDHCTLIREDGTEQSLGNRHAAVRVYADLAAAALRRWAEWPGEDE